MERWLSVVTLGVADLARSQRFYENGLGFLCGNSSEEIVFFELNGVTRSGNLATSCDEVCFGSKAAFRPPYPELPVSLHQRTRRLA